MSLEREPAEQMAQNIADTPAANPVIRFFKSHPTGFWFFFWGEFAERCSFYGMRAILATYMADQLAFGEASGGTYAAYFFSACYFLPLLGGWVADRFFGKYWTIVGFSLPYILGQFLIGIESIPFLVIALVLLAMGSGVIKPNISTLMGLTYDQQRPGQTKLRSDAFALFYFAINVGAAISMTVVPKIRDASGYAVAFMFPAALMALAFLIFAAGKKYYAVETVGRRQTTPEEKADRWRVLGRVGGLFLLVMFFWAVFDQQSITWIYFSRSCMNLKLFGMDLAAEQIQALNSLFILILLPTITVFFGYLDRRGIKVRPTRKMLVGFLLTAGCMGIMSLAATLAGDAERRPAIVKGEDLKLVVNGGSHPVVLKGNMKVNVAGSGEKITVSRESRGNEDGKAKIIKESWTLLPGDGLLELEAVGEGNPEQARAFTIKGDLKTIEKDLDKEKKETLATGKLAATVGIVEGKSSVETRWFVAPAMKVTVWWQVFAYFVITIAEVLISVTGLEMGYTAAPKSMTGFVTGMWLSTVGLANLLINAPVTQLYSTMQPARYFGMLALVLLVVSVAFVFVARAFNRGAETA